MKILFIGGTGNISLSASKLLLSLGHDLTILNRSGQHEELPGAHFIRADINHAKDQLQNKTWDCVVNWIAFSAQDVERDIALFSQSTNQYLFISSASCYKNPGPTAFITEATPLENPFWQYSRDKINAEQKLWSAFQTKNFPITIVRPSHTYSRVIPLTVGGWLDYNAVARMKAGKPVVVQGDGTSLWTLTHADDFAQGLVGLLGNQEAIGEAFHITSDEILSWNQIYQLTASAVGVEAQIVHVTSDQICAIDPAYTGSLLGDKSVSTMFDNSKIKRFVPSFCARTSYQEGIKATLQWFEAEQARQRIDPATEVLMEHLISSMRLGKQLGR